MLSSRRSFLLAAGTSSAAALWPRMLRAQQPAVSSTAQDLVIGGVTFARASTMKVGHALLGIDPAGELQRNIVIGFRFHGLAVHPGDRRRAVLFEKVGPGACEVDLGVGRMVRPVTTTPDRTFYGHGAFAPDGKVVYVTESVTESDEGVISIRDGGTLALAGEFPSFGARPHDCVLVDGGRTLVITNGGGELDQTDLPPSVTFVDVASRRLLEKLPFKNPRINGGHLALTSARDLVVVSAPRLGIPPDSQGAVSFRPAGGAFRTMTEPARVVRGMIGETLSIAIHEPSSVVGVTNPDGKLLTFWNYRKGKLVKSLPMDYPRGITRTRDGQYFVVSHGHDKGALAYISTKTLAIDPRRASPDIGLSSSHIYTWQPA